MTSENLRELHIKWHSVISILLPLISLLAISIGGTAFALAQPRMYESVARLWIKPKLPTDQSQAKDIYSPLTYFFTDPLHTVCELIASEAVLTDALSSIKTVVPAKLCPKYPELIAGLTATPVTAADIVVVRFRGSDPKVDKAILQSVIDSFLKLNNSQMCASAIRSREFMENQLRQAREKESAARERLRRFQDEHGAVNMNSQVNSLLAQEMKNNSDIEDIKLDIAATNAKLDELRSRLHITPDQADAALKISHDELIKSLIGELAKRQTALFDLNPRLKDNHPRVKKAKAAIERIKNALKDRARDLAGDFGVSVVDGQLTIDDVHQEKLLDQLADNQNELVRLEANLAKDVSGADVLRTQLKEIPALQTQLGELTRQADNATAELTSAENQLRQLQSTEFVATRSSNIQVIDYPTEPSAPISPNIPVTIGASLMFAVVFSGALFYLLNFLLSPFLNGVGNVVAMLEMPIVGWCKEPPNNVLLQRMLPLMKRVRHAFSISAGANQRRIVVSSSDQAEGKSLVAATLAMSFAQTGARVVYIDTNFAKPASPELFGVQNYPGLSDYLARPNADLLPKIIRPMEGGTNLNVITPGSELKDSSMLDSEGFHLFLKQLESEADVIVIDSPAISESPDAVSMLSPDVHLLFVVHLGHTLRTSARLAANEFSSAKVASSGVFIFGAEESDILAATATPRVSPRLDKPAAEASVW